MTVGRRKRHYDDGRAVLQLRRVARLSVGCLQTLFEERATRIFDFRGLARRTPALPVVEETRKGTANTSRVEYNLVATQSLQKL